jgi:flagellar biosynthesis/type III secretory pathway protein FliH
MHSFCVDTITVNPHLRPRHGILHATGLPIANDARRAARLLTQQAQAGADAMLNEARNGADDILAQARDEAGRLLADAREQASKLSAAERQKVAVQAAELLQVLEQANRTILDQVEDLAASLARTLFDRLVMETTPHERIAASLRRVLQEAPPKLADALLRVHPDDVALLPPVDWPLKADMALARGACRLEAASGQWCAGFDVAVQDLTAAFTQGIAAARRTAAAAQPADAP